MCVRSLQAALSGGGAGVVVRASSLFLSRLRFVCVVFCCDAIDCCYMRRFYCCTEFCVADATLNVNLWMAIDVGAHQPGSIIIQIKYVYASMFQQYTTKIYTHITNMYVIYICIYIQRIYIHTYIYMIFQYTSRSCSKTEVFCLGGGLDSNPVPPQNWIPLFRVYMMKLDPWYRLSLHKSKICKQS